MENMEDPPPGVSLCAQVVAPAARAAAVTAPCARSCMNADVATYHSWQSGLNHLLVVLMSPSVPEALPRPDPTGEASPPGAGLPPPALQQMQDQPAEQPAQAQAAEGPGIPSTPPGSWKGALTSKVLLGLLGVHVRTSSRAGRRQPHLRSQHSGVSHASTAGAFAGDSDSIDNAGFSQQQEPISDGQLRKRQQFADYLSAVLLGGDWRGQRTHPPPHPRKRLQPEMVSVAVQTDESELQQQSQAAHQAGHQQQWQQHQGDQRQGVGQQRGGASGQWAAASGGTPEGGEQGGTDGDASLAAAYAAAMQPPGTAPLADGELAHDVGASQQLRALPGAGTGSECSGDAAVAATYAAALSGTAATGSGLPWLQPPFGNPTVQQQSVSPGLSLAYGLLRQPHQQQQQQLTSLLQSVSASLAATPPGGPSLLAVNVDVIDFDDLRFGKLLGEGGWAGLLARSAGILAS